MSRGPFRTRDLVLLRAAGQQSTSGHTPQPGSSYQMYCHNITRDLPPGRKKARFDALSILAPLLAPVSVPCSILTRTYPVHSLRHCLPLGCNKTARDLMNALTRNLVTTIEVACYPAALSAAALAVVAAHAAANAA